MDVAQTASTHNRKDNDFFRKQHNSTISFAIAILLFLLPFAEFKCGSVTLIDNSGIGIAAGRSWRVAASWNKNEIMQKLNTGSKEEKDMMKDGPNVFALAALLAGAFGIAVAISSFKWRSVAGMCAGILGAVMLLAMMIQIRLEMRSLMSKGGSDDALEAGMEGIIGIRFTTWYYLSLVSFIAAAFLNYKRDKLALQEEINRSLDFEFQQKQEEGGGVGGRPG